MAKRREFNPTDKSIDVDLWTRHSQALTIIASFLADVAQSSKGRDGLGFDEAAVSESAPFFRTDIGDIPVTTFFSAVGFVDGYQQALKDNGLPPIDEAVPTEGAS